MRTIIIITLLLILSTAVYSDNKFITLGKGENVTVGGRVFTLLSVSDDQMLLDIDGQQKILSILQQEDFDDIHIDVGLIYWPNKYRNLSIELNISTDFTCGNNKCDSSDGESKFNCCKDCNCSTGYKCYQNQCVKSDLLQCYTDEECDDGNPCTVDYCSDFPKYCKNDAVTECKDIDGCCPDGCSDDWDCTVSLVCLVDEGCDDDNKTTIDRCYKEKELCYYTLNETYVMEENVTNVSVIEQDATSENETTSEIIAENKTEDNTSQITGNLTGEGWNSQKKTSAIKRFFEWLLGWI